MINLPVVKPRETEKVFGHGVDMRKSEQPKNASERAESTTGRDKTLAWMLPILLATQNDVCPLCGKPILTEHVAEVDHILPVSAWPADTPERVINALPNCQAVHGRCNRVKGKRVECEAVYADCRALPYAEHWTNNGLCQRCGTAPLTARGANARYCAPCAKLNSRDCQREYREANPDKVAAAMRRWREANPNWFREHYAANRDRILGYCRAWYHERGGAAWYREYNQTPERKAGARRASATYAEAHPGRVARNNTLNYRKKQYLVAIGLAKPPVRDVRLSGLWTAELEQRFRAARPEFYVDMDSPLPAPGLRTMKVDNGTRAYRKKQWLVRRGIATSGGDMNKLKLTDYMTPELEAEFRSEHPELYELKTEETA